MEKSLKSMEAITDSIFSRLSSRGVENLRLEGSVLKHNVK
jgi:hypothetical protein